MTPHDDDDEDDFDPTGAGAEVRELRERVRELEAMVLRHTAELDQLSAMVAEGRARADEADIAIADLEASMAELRVTSDLLDARITRTARLYAWLIPLTWAVSAAAIGVNLWNLW